MLYWQAKTLAQEYSKYQSSVEEINMQFGSAQKMVERDAINSKFEEQMRLGVDSAYRNGVDYSPAHTHTSTSCLVGLFVLPQPSSRLSQ